MAVTFSHGDAAWPSGPAFHAFRKRLAASVDVELDAMEGFHGNVPWDSIQEPIRPLLAASELNGRLTWQEAWVVGQGLEELLSSYRIDESADRHQARSLVLGLEVAAMRGEPFIVRSSDLLQSPWRNVKGLSPEGHSLAERPVAHLDQL